MKPGCGLSPGLLTQHVQKQAFAWHRGSGTGSSCHWTSRHLAKHLGSSFGREQRLAGQTKTWPSGAKARIGWVRAYTTRVPGDAHAVTVAGKEVHSGRVPRSKRGTLCKGMRSMPLNMGLYRTPR